MVSSCYHKELSYSFFPSYGGVTVGSSQYFLAQAREFQRPKGISTFPDGGMTKDVRCMFGLFKTDTITNSTILVARLGNTIGWPSRYATRITKNDSYIAFGIANVTKADSANGIYLYNLKKGIIERYSNQGALPSLLPQGSLLTYCIVNRLVVEDFSTKTLLYSYLLNFNPIFASWKSENEIYLFLSDPFRVKFLNISTGKITDSDLKYIRNYDQELDITQINKFFKGNTQISKELLDNYY